MDMVYKMVKGSTERETNPPKVVIIDDNPVSLSQYCEEYGDEVLKAKVIYSELEGEER